jgi:hypothetical protein
LKYTFLSKWTVLILTVVTAALAYVGFSFLNGTFGTNALLGTLALLVGGLVYAIAWIIGFADSIQERRWGWTVALVILLPVWVGPLLYSLFGPRNTK